jgi:ATP:ADP antiporter, AAA family
MPRTILPRALSPFVEIRPQEVASALMMFAYAFLAMTSYNIMQPLTRSKLIADLGARNIPYVLLGLGVASAIVMVGYTRLVAALPRRWALPITQTLMAGLMIGFWALFQTEQEWASVAFYIWGALFSVLLISQFWTLANGIYDPRQAKRLFGFIGGGVTIGGMTGAGITAFLITTLGTNTLVLISAAVLLACAALVAMIVGRESAAAEAVAARPGVEDRGVTLGRAFELLRASRQVQLIAVIIGFGSIGAALIEQQLNMAAENLGQEEAIGQFLAFVRFYLGIVATVLQVWVTPRIHRYLGVGFALMLLPANLVLTAIGIIMTVNIWAPATARIADQSLRYTIDKTTREVLFLPLSVTLRQEVKPFVDVTVDRLSRAVGALFMLILIQPWGLNLIWYQLSFVSVGFAAVWFVMAIRAKHEYLASFRRSLEQRDVAPAELRLNVADLLTVETLIEELASPDERRVLYSIDILESLDKRNLITPLLLYHESAAVRVRALQALGAARPEMAERWLPNIQRMLGDASAEVRAAAVGALASIRNEQAVEILRPFLDDADPRVSTTAAGVLARGGTAVDVTAAEAVLSRLAAETSEAAAPARREVAAALAQLREPRFRVLLIPLLSDPSLEVAERALRSVRQLGEADFAFVPTLLTLLRHRVLKSAARDVIVGYGEPVLDILEHFLREPEEDIWVRRHLPATIALIASQRSMDILVDALEEPDGFLRYKVVAAIQKLHRDHPDLVLKREPIEQLAIRESTRYFTYLSLHYNLFVREALPPDYLLADALGDKMRRTEDRVYRLLGLLYPWKDIAAARWAIQRGDSRARASALEYLDNLLSGPIRKRVMGLLEDHPIDEKVRRANVLLRTRPRDAEETLLQLINDEDPVISAAAIDLVQERKLWSLAEDIEHVLAHRDVRDWHVFEAASWALAGHRMPESRRRTLWLEPLPAVQLAARLRRIPLFAAVSVDELFRVANLGRQVRHESGTPLYYEGQLPDQTEFLLDGRVTVTVSGRDPVDLTPPEALGFDAVLEGVAMRETIRTSEPSVCLVLNADETRTMVSYNSELVQGLFAMLAGQAAADTSRAVVKGAAAADLIADAASSLEPIEKVLVVQRIPAFTGIASEEILALAGVARDVRLEEGSPLFAEAEPPAIYAVLGGCVSLASAGHEGALVAEGGDVIGMYEALAGIRWQHRAIVTREGRALRIDREDLFDLLTQRPALLQQLFGVLFRLRRAAVEAVA